MNLLQGSHKNSIANINQSTTDTYQALNNSLLNYSRNDSGTRRDMAGQNNRSNTFKQTASNIFSQWLLFNFYHDIIIRF